MVVNCITDFFFYTFLIHYYSKYTYIFVTSPFLSLINVTSLNKVFQFLKLRTFRNMRRSAKRMKTAQNKWLPKYESTIKIICI